MVMTALQALPNDEAAQAQVAVTHLPPGATEQTVLARVNTCAQAEDWIAEREKTDAEGVHRGDYGIDLPEHLC